MDFLYRGRGVGDQSQEKIHPPGYLACRSRLEGGMLKLKNPLPCYVVSSMSHAAPCVASSMLQAQFCAAFIHVSEVR